VKLGNLILPVKVSHLQKTFLFSDFKNFTESDKKKCDQKLLIDSFLVFGGLKLIFLGSYRGDIMILEHSSKRLEKL